MTLIVGESAPKWVLIPNGVVHEYQIVGTVDGLVIISPNRLYMGDGRREPIDEIRHEDDPQTLFTMND
jgi:dTDP-4-dehydrorhamnose 3,5-epimerase